MATFVRVGEKTKAIVRKQGFPTKAKTFLRLTDAKKWAKSLEAQIESGSVDSNVVLRHYTLEDSLKHYFISCERRNLKALKYIQAHSRIIRKAIGHLRLYDLTVKKLEEYRDSRLQTVSPASVKHEIGIIKRSLAEFCNSKGLTGYQAPAIRPPKISNARSRRLKSDELATLLSVISNYEVKCGTNLPAEVDPYDIGLPNWQGSKDNRRTPLKKIINALINDEDGDYKLANTKDFYGVTPRELRKLFQKTHPVVYERLADGIGLESQFVDSQIAESVMLRMLKDGIVCLPIHDSFLVPSGYHQILSSVMKDSFREVTGANISVDLDIVRTDQHFGKTEDEILQQQQSDPEVGILGGKESWETLVQHQQKLTTQFIQSWRVWSSN